MNPIKLIGLTTALGAAMTAAASQISGVFPGSTDFEGVTLPDSYTDSANGAAIVAGTPGVAARPANYNYADTRASVLSTADADGTVWRNLKADGSATALSGGAIYADLLFNASAVATSTPTAESGDKLLVYLKEENGATNLCVFAYGGIGQEGLVEAGEGYDGTGQEFKLANPIAADNWNRLVIEALNEVDEECPVPGYKIYLGGYGPSYLCSTADGLYAFVWLPGDEATDGSVASIGFRGDGLVDDLVVSTLDPSVDQFDWATHLGAAVDGAYQIDDEAELIAFQQGVANGLATANTTFKLTTDIALTAAWPGIGVQNGKDIYNTAAFDDAAFCGIFDGQNHTISGFQMVGVADNPANNNEGLDYCGFFNSTYGATIRNLKIQYAGALFAIDTTSGTHESGATFVGVAKNSTLQNLTSLQKDASTAVSCSKGFGGIVGYLTSGTTVDSCTNNVNMTSLANNKCGGIAMIAQGGAAVTIRNCQNNGTQTTGSSNSEYGAIVGYVGLDITIANCETTVGRFLKHQGNTVTLQGVNKGDAGVLAYHGAATPGLNFATFSGNVATFVADTALAAGNTYKVMATGASYQFTTAGSITFDESLATASVTAAEGLELTNDAGSPVKTYTAAPPAAADWADPATITEGTTAAEQYSELAKTELSNADAKKLTQWADTYSVDYADVADDPGAYVDAFLLNCDPDDVDDEKEAFVATITIDDNGVVTVAPPAGNTYNGQTYLQGANVLSNDPSDWSPVGAGQTGNYKFFRLVLDF